MSQFKGDFENLQRTKPLIRTVSNLRNATNNIRMFADSFEQLLNSVENFAPTLEAAAKGSELIASKFAPPRRPPQARPEANPQKVTIVEEGVEGEEII